MSTEDVHFDFSIGKLNFSIDFQEEKQSSEKTVCIGGRNYSIKGDEFRVAYLREKISAVPKRESLDVQGCLEKIGANKSINTGKTQQVADQHFLTYSKEAPAALGRGVSLSEVSPLFSIESSDGIREAERVSKRFKREYDTLLLRRDVLKASIKRGEHPDVEAFNKEVEDYSARAAAFQDCFEAEFLDNTSAGFYSQDIIAPEGLQRCGIGEDRYLSYRVQDNREDGQCPVFLFEAGLGSAGTFDGSSLAKQMKDDSCCWVTYDRSGTGRSPARTEEMSNKPLIDYVEEDFDQLLSHLEKQGVNPPVILVAHSLGAIYAQNYALKHPDKIAGIVLIDPASENDKDAKEESLSLRASSKEERNDLIKVPKNFLAVQQNGQLTRGDGGGPTPLHPPTESEVQQFAPNHMKSFSEEQKNENWWMTAHQKQADSFLQEKEEFTRSAAVLKGALLTREPSKMRSLVFEKRVENGKIELQGGQEGDYSQWRRETLTARFGRGKYIRSEVRDHNLQFFDAERIAGELRSCYL